MDRGGAGGGGMGKTWGEGGGAVAFVASLCMSGIGRCCCDGGGGGGGG